MQRKTLRPFARSRRQELGEEDFETETFYEPEPVTNNNKPGDKQSDFFDLPYKQAENADPNIKLTKKTSLKKDNERNNRSSSKNADSEEALYGDDNLMQEEKKLKSKANELKVDNNDLLLPEEDEPERKNIENNRLKRLKKGGIANDDSQMILEESKSIHSEPKPEQHTCAICLSEITDVVAKLDSCTHVFCFSCIKDWSNVANQCPLCKNRFKRISKFTKTGIKLGDLRVKHKEQVAPEEPAFEILEDTDDYCYECGTDTNMLQMLVCDECEFHCCHTYCCDPPLHRVPLEPWYCKFCRPPVRPQPQYNRSNTMSRALESTVTKSIRNSLAENSLLHKLFEVADKEIEKRFKSTIRRSSTTRSPPRSKTPKRGRERQRSTKKKATKKTKGSPRERTRTKSKSKKRAVKTTGTKKSSRSVSKPRKSKAGKSSRGGGSRKNS